MTGDLTRPPSTDGEAILELQTARCLGDGLTILLRSPSTSDLQAVDRRRSTPPGMGRPRWLVSSARRGHRAVDRTEGNVRTHGDGCSVDASGGTTKGAAATIYKPAVGTTKVVVVKPVGPIAPVPTSRSEGWE